jgi:DNA-binding protein H-NS
VPTLEQIQAKMKKLQAQADSLIAKKSATVLKTIHDLMEKHGLTAGDIDAHAGGKKRGPKVVTKAAAKVHAATVKYRDPKTGATWSGHGRPPGWIASAKNRDRFLVDGGTVPAKPASASKAKNAGNYVRKPQPAMYRDPSRARRGVDVDAHQHG